MNLTALHFLAIVFFICIFCMLFGKWLFGFVSAQKVHLEKVALGTPKFNILYQYSLEA